MSDPSDASEGAGALRSSPHIVPAGARPGNRCGRIRDLPLPLFAAPAEETV